MANERELVGEVSEATLSGTLSLGGSGGGDVTWSSIIGKPETFTPSAHTHAQSDVTGLATALADKQDKLIAGANIYFSDDGKTINAAGGGGGGGGGDVTWASILNKPDTFPPSAHTQGWDTITDKPDTYTPATHTHAQSDVTGLSTALGGKADSSHTHAQSDITGLSTALAGKASKTHSHNMFTYSTTEQSIGTWVDGKTLYRKTIVDATTHSVPNALTETTIATVGLSGAIDTMVSIEGGYHVSGTGWMQLCRVRSASILSGVNYHENSDTIRLYTVGASYTLDKAIVILTYTKN